jgi:tetratricopeptide (TPR) repeat protein
MIARVDGERFRLLDTLRAYSLEMLDDIDADATRDRHARCFTRLAEEGETAIRGHEQITGLERVRADLPNHRAALDWLVTVGDDVGAARLAGALGWFWTLDGALSDACTQLGTILAFPTLPAPERAKLSWSLALVVASLGDLRRAEELARGAIDCGHEARDLVQVGFGLNALAVAQWGLGDLDGAEASRDEAIRLFEAHHEPWGAAVSRVLRGRTALDRGNPDTGALVAEGLAAAEAIGDRHLIGMAHEQAARLALRVGDLDAALSSADLALRDHSEIGYTEGALGARHILGSALRERGELDAAMAEHLAALRSAQAIDHRAVLCEALEDVALVHQAAGRAARAQELVDVAGEERCRLALPRRADDATRLIEGFGARPGPPERCDDVADAGGRADFDAVVAQLLADRIDAGSMP